MEDPSHKSAILSMQVIAPLVVAQWLQYSRCHTDTLTSRKVHSPHISFYWLVKPYPESLYRWISLTSHYPGSNHLPIPKPINGKENETTNIILDQLRTICPWLIFLEHMEKWPPYPNKTGLHRQRREGWAGKWRLNEQATVSATHTYHFNKSSSKEILSLFIDEKTKA